MRGTVYVMRDGELVEKARPDDVQVMSLRPGSAEWWNGFEAFQKECRDEITRVFSGTCAKRRTFRRSARRSWRKG